MVTAKNHDGKVKVCFYDQEKQEWFWQDTKDPVENLELLHIDLKNEIGAIRHIRANTDQAEVSPDYYRRLSNAATRLEEAEFWLNSAKELKAQLDSNVSEA